MPQSPKAGCGMKGEKRREVTKLTLRQDVECGLRSDPVVKFHKCRARGREDISVEQSA